MTEAQAVCVDPALVAQVWPVTREMIRSAMVRGGMSEFAEVEQDVLCGGSLVWLAWDGHVILAAAVTRLDMVNGAKVGTIVACGGSDLSKFGDLRARLEQFFRDEGCHRARICGRKGWLRHYPDYKVRALILEKELS